MNAIKFTRRPIVGIRRHNGYWAIFIGEVALMTCATFDDAFEALQALDEVQS